MALTLSKSPLQILLTLNWPAVPSATAYNIYKDGSNTPFYTGSALTITDILNLDESHYYQVTSVVSSVESARVLLHVNTSLKTVSEQYLSSGSRFHSS